MRILGTIDLEILHLAVTSDGRISESDLEHSALKRLGVGRLLDGLASLRDRDLLKLDSGNGAFYATDKARGMLWDQDTPLETRILRLLEIQSGSIPYIAKTLLLDDSKTLTDTLRMLQEGGFVMMSTQIRGGSGNGGNGGARHSNAPDTYAGRPERVYEILPDGIKIAENTEFWQTRDGGAGTRCENAGAASTGAAHILRTIDDVSRMISASDTIGAEEKRAITQKISGLRDALEEMLGDE